jgi:hypothetical protein
MAMNIPRRPRLEPTFEGDRQAANMREMTRRVDAQTAEQEMDQPITRTGGPSDYAQPDVRALANLEAEVAQTFTADPEYKKPERSRDIGNSHDMKKVQQLVNNSITAAHDDTCKVLDKFVAEIRAMAEEAERDVEEYKKTFQSNGQEIAARMEARMHTITNTVATIEQLTLALRKPELESKPAESIESITEETPTAER